MTKKGKKKKGNLKKTKDERNVAGAVAVAAALKVEMVSHIASGGQGHVILSKRDGDTICVKMLKEPTSAAKARFVREVSALKLFKDHEWCPSLIYENEQHFGLEYLDTFNTVDSHCGGFKREWDGKSFTDTQKDAIISHLCTALAVIHKAGHVYRDLKPNNVMVKLTSDSVDLRLIDYGLVAPVDVEGKEKEDLVTFEGEPFPNAMMHLIEFENNSMSNRNPISDVTLVVAFLAYLHYGLCRVDQSSSFQLLREIVDLRHRSITEKAFQIAFEDRFQTIDDLTDAFAKSEEEHVELLLQTLTLHDEEVKMSALMERLLKRLRATVQSVKGTHVQRYPAAGEGGTESFTLGGYKVELRKAIMLSVTPPGGSKISLYTAALSEEQILNHSTLTPFFGTQG